MFTQYRVYSLAGERGREGGGREGGGRVYDLGWLDPYRERERWGFSISQCRIVCYNLYG